MGPGKGVITVVVEVKVAAFGLLGVVVGAYVTSCSSEKVAMAQIQSQQKLATSEAAIKLIEYRSAPMADIYSAFSKFQSASFQAADDAARQLSVAAAVAAARIGGETGKLCRELSELSASYSTTSISIAAAAKFDLAGKIGGKISEVMTSFDLIQKPIFEKVLASDSTVR
jgi:hypothetical protein